MSYDVLVVVAHGDDDVLGAGGSLFMHAERGDRVHLLVMTDTDSSRHGSVRSQAQGRRESIEAAASIMGVRSVIVKELLDNRLDMVPQLDLVQTIEERVQHLRPSIVYTHSSFDLSVDHRSVAHATAVACRPAESTLVPILLGIEIVSSTDWAEVSGRETFHPSQWQPLSKEAVLRKMRALECYRQEMRPPPHSRSVETIKALLLYRGAQIHSEAAEAFQVMRRVQYL